MPAEPADPLVAFAAPGTDAPGGAVYLGFGLATREGLGTGRLPLDALAMILVAERRRAATGADRIVHLVADQHALVNGFATRREVAHRASVLVEELEALVGLLGLGTYAILRASEIADGHYFHLLAEAGSVWPEPYAARQAADVEWVRRAHDVGVKVGWSMATRPGLSRGFDEPHFDRVHRLVFGEGLGTVYAAPGRTLDPGRPRCSPYTLLPGQPRLTFASGPDAVRRQCASAGMRKHLRPLCDRALAHLGLDPPGELADRLDMLLTALRLHELTGVRA